MSHRVFILYNAVSHFQRPAEVKLNCLKLVRGSLQIYHYLVSRYNTTEDHTSELGLKISLSDKHNCCKLLHRSTLKC